MSSIFIALLMVIGLFVLVLLGVHIAFSLALMSLIGIVLIQGDFFAGVHILATTTFEGVRSYAFAVAPLFMLMGAFMSNSSIAKDLFIWCGAIMKKIPGGLGVATVLANAIFAAVTGISIASAAIFGKIAVPQMTKQHYDAEFAAGTVAGSSVLGMLIPPSMMFILYGMLAEVSIGKMFIAGIIPGIILAIMFAILVISMAKIRPDAVYEEGYIQKAASELKEIEESEKSFAQLSLAVVPTIILIILILGGIWMGWFTPTEAAGVGAFGALIVAIITGMRLDGFKAALLETAGSTSSILFLIITATMYSRMLALSGAVTWLNSMIIGMDVSPYVILVLFIVLVLILGCVLDSSSILLIVTPLMAPVMLALGFDMIWFGVILVLAVHLGLLTPPFGICVFAVKAAIDVPMKIEKIFMRCMPYLGVMVVHIAICIIFPQLCTWLPAMMSA